MLKLGFTGTRHGMTEVQLKEFKKLVDSKQFEEFHHGVCVGSDKQAHDYIDSIKKERNIKVVGHPGQDKKHRADCECDIMMKPLPYLDRNKNIISHADILIATPDTKERVRSGTWATVRYGRKKGMRIYVIHKNGRVEIESETK